MPFKVPKDILKWHFEFFNSVRKRLICSGTIQTNKKYRRKARRKRIRKICGRVMKNRLVVLMGISFLAFYFALQAVLSADHKRGRETQRLRFVADVYG